MRKLALLFLSITSLLATSAATAAPKNNLCQFNAADGPKATRFPTNCFADEIFILDGNEMVTDAMGAQKPLVMCAPKSAMDATLNPKDCFLLDKASYPGPLGSQAAARKALEIIKSKGGAVPPGGWDEIVVFTENVVAASNPAGPLFYREQNADKKGFNKVRNLGLGDVVMPDDARPYVGVIDAGNTKTFYSAADKQPWTGQYGPCGKAPRRPIDEPSASDQAAAALCAPGVYNYMDALAQATASIYGPQLTGIYTSPQIKGNLVNAPAGMGALPTPKLPGVGATVWNSFLDTQGSLLGGNTWRDNGNGTFETTKPPAYYGVSAPYDGTQVVRFKPMDLYILGFMDSKDPLLLAPIKSFMKAAAANLYQPSLGSFNAGTGPNMGTRVSGVILKTAPQDFLFGQAVADSGGERDPAAGSAPQFIKQLWVLVTRPRNILDEGDQSQVFKDGAMDGAKVRDDALKDQWTQVANLQRTRRMWGQYFYMLTGWRGRAISTFEGDDDTAYWEFGDPTDDNKTFVGEGGLQMRVDGHVPIPNGGGKISTVAVISTPGDGGRLVLKPSPAPYRIQGDDPGQYAPNNIVTIRMRLPNDPGLMTKIKAAKNPLRIFAKVSFEGGPEVEIPKAPGTLIPDGKLRNYSASLKDYPDFSGKEYRSLAITPSSEPFQAGDADSRNWDPNLLVQIDYVKVANVASPGDTDKGCDGKAKPDGWVDSEDNCPKLFNPYQDDGNGDGVGDACEDYDGDNVVNGCDNCPTFTNSRQKDGDKDGRGDICDDEKKESCFFRPETIAGPVRGSAGVSLAALVIALMGTVVLRRRKR